MSPKEMIEELPRLCGQLQLDINTSKDTKTRPSENKVDQALRLQAITTCEKKLKALTVVVAFMGDNNGGLELMVGDLAAKLHFMHVEVAASDTPRKAVEEINNSELTGQLAKSE